MKRLPLNIDIETKVVLRRLPAAHAALAELKGIASSMPNERILFRTLVLREAKDSSAVENIITTHDELYKSQIELSGALTSHAKEVQNYVAAVQVGLEHVNHNGFISNRTILAIQNVLEGNSAGFRKLPGTVLRNEESGEVIYTPPQHPEEVLSLMDNFVNYLNDDSQNIDPLVKMAILHHQFESIHPFYDGNGRTGRILNILFLILNRLQEVPILYLSQYIIRNKQEYYQLLQVVRENDDWESWVIFMLNAVEYTAKDTIKRILKIKDLMQVYKLKIRDNYKFYSQDLLNNIFSHPYTKIDILMEDLSVSRVTAANYLNRLAEDGLLEKATLGRSNYYINKPLYQILSDDET